MKRITLFYFSFIFFISGAFAQANVWYFGDYAGLKFNGTGTPTALNNSAMRTGEGSAVMTDKAGNLLFYTDGIAVWNSKHNKDITGMKGHGSSTQTALIIPVPETDCKRYFIFTVGGVEDFSIGANVTLVEMSGDATSGTTIKKIEGPTRMYSASVTEKLNGVKDGSGGYWVVNHEWQNNKYHSYHVTKNTTDITKLLATDVVTAIGKSQTGTLTNGQGQLKFSRDGKKMAIAVAQDKYAEFYDFDLSTGKPSNVQLIQSNDANFPSFTTIFSNSANVYGLEFSNSGQFLYVADFYTGGNAKIYQFDLSSGNLGTIRSTHVVLGSNSHSSNYPYGAMQMGPDGKIWIAKNDRYSLAVINKPELSGTSANFVENGVTLTKLCYNGLPTTIVVDMCCTINKPFLGRDTSFCQGQQFILKDTVKNVSTYWWSDNSNMPSLTVSKAGQYWVEIAIGGCKNRDTINITIKKSPKVDLGKDSILCDFKNFTLGNSLKGPKYLWSTSETTKTIKPTSVGKYWVQVDSNGCKASDTVLIFLTSFQKPSLGNDTMACEGKTISINGFTPNAKSYSWNTSNNVPVQDVTTSGTYILSITDNKCTFTDTIVVNFIPYPNVNIGRDTGFCGDFSLILNAGNPGLNKIWNTNETTQTITVTNQHGLYWVDVSNQGCKKRDTMVINKLNGPNVNLGNDSVFCTPISLVLNAKNPGMNYLWDNAGTAQTYPINSPGKYWVRVTDSKGCVVSDTIEIKDSSFSFSFRQDTTVCYGQTVVLKGKPKPFTNSWLGVGSTADSIIVNASGNYKLTVSNGSCKKTDSIAITVRPPINLELGPDTTVCDDLGEVLNLSAPSGFKNYKWQPGGETSPGIVVKQPGIFSVTIIDNNDCEASDNIQVIKLCPLAFWVSTAFTPSSESVNGKFGVSYQGPPVVGFEMLIYNRWGELIYKSNDINAWWDGNYMSKPCQLGMYMAIVHFNSKLGNDLKRCEYKGMFYLNR
ncbi:MAG: gliding motility-associated C-terminal domain-containing protein [Bacteroidia bacterium]